MSWPMVTPAMWDQASAVVDAVGGAADDDDELDLPVDRRADDGDVVEGPGEAGGELREDGGDLRQGGAGLLGVAAVVEPDGEHLPRSWHRVPQCGFDERAGWRGDGGREVVELVPLVVEGHRVGTEASVGCGGDVGDLITEDERGAAVDVGELHSRAPCRAGWCASRVRRWSMRAAAPAGEAGGAVEVEVGSLQSGGGVVLGEPAAVRRRQPATVTTRPPIEANQSRVAGSRSMGSASMVTRRQPAPCTSSKRAAVDAALRRTASRRGVSRGR